MISYFLDEENWRGKNTQKKTYGKNRRAVESMLNPMMNVCDTIMNLKNGYFSTHKNCSIQSINTCSFDSFYVVIAVLYADYPNIKDAINQLAKDHKFLQLITNMFTKDGINVKQQKLLNQRNIVILEALKDVSDAISFQNGLILLNCNTNVNFIIPRLLPSNLYSYSRQKQCTVCHHIRISNRCFVDIDMEKFENSTIQDLNRCLNDVLNTEKSYCPVKDCEGAESITTIKFSDFVLIDLQLVNAIKKVPLNDIPRNLNISGNQFRFSSCIEFIGSTIPGAGIGHYVAHVLRSNNRWYRYDDMSNKIIYSNINVMIQAQILFYVKQ